MYLNASSLSGIFLLKSETIGLPRFHLFVVSFGVAKIWLALCTSSWHLFMPTFFFLSGQDRKAEKLHPVVGKGAKSSAVLPQNGIFFDEAPGNIIQHDTTYRYIQDNTTTQK